MKLKFWQQKERVSEESAVNQTRQRHLVANIINRLTSLTLLSVILPIGVINTSISQEVKSEEIKNSIVEPAIVSLAIDSPKVLDSSFDISEIKPGESVVQKERREKAEALARSRAEAEAKLREQRNIISRDGRHYDDPVNFQDIYQRAEAKYGVDARLLQAVHYVETGQSGSTTKRNPSGATGPMQFLPSTWRNNGADGNGDGVADIHNVEDAIFGAANYLKACGYPNIKSALWGYNPSNPYYRKVTGIAKELGMQVN